MKIIIKVILVIVIVILCIYCGVARLEQKENEIKKWASDHNYVIVSKEMNYTIFAYDTIIILRNRRRVNKIK